MQPLRLKDPDGDAGEVWGNRTYHVVRREMATWDGRPLVQLAISRHNRQPARDWRHLQQIKNQLVGAECEAVELFPDECRLVDTCNVTHLWCRADPAFCFPFGYEEREVGDGRLDQRPFDRKGRHLITDPVADPVADEDFAVV